MSVPALPSWSDPHEAVARLKRLVFSQGCARVGEAAVVSTCVHTFDPKKPDSVGVMLGVDAGRVFYRRNTAGEVVHIDVFHEVAEVDHRTVAVWLERAVAVCRCGVLSDYIDVQTGTGGGRLTGTLKFGKKASLRRAHMNHVHVTVKAEPCQTELLLWLVAAVECAIMERGVEIRRVRQLLPEQQVGGSPQDMSPYSTPTDSMLREDHGERLSEQHKMTQCVMELAEELGGVSEVERALEEIASNEEHDIATKMKKQRFSGWQDQPEKLMNRGLAKREGRNLVLTERGWQMRDFLTEKSREIEMEFKRLLRKCPRIKPPREKQTYSTSMSQKPGRAWGMRAVGIQKGEWASQIAVAETVTASMTRTRGEVAISAEDIRTYRDRAKRAVDVCLLIDASASMAGKRIRAAKYLAQHLVLAGRDRIAVVVFQEGAVKVEVPFTRRFTEVQAGLARIQPLGLTPLAEGLVKSVEFIEETRARKPLLLLVTDGIPTVPKWTLNPLEDSLTAASNLPRTRLRFGCIGLQPNRSFLQALCRRARGTLYIVDELERETLANIAHKERAQATATLH